jgi:phage terminase large subunit
VMQDLFTPARYKVFYGGRGGVKSWSFARALLLKAAQTPLRILCAREYQSSIKESVHQLLCDQIKLMGLSDYYTIKDTKIESLAGAELIFAGLKKEINKVKSMEGIDICWVEEAEKVSENSWMVLIPTIRKAGSEIWISFNPHEETDPTYKRFVLNSPPGAIVRETGWQDNPWLPKELQMEKDYLAKVDKDAYDHVWGGQILKKSSAQVMHGKCVIDDFVPGEDWNGPYFGADWGFASDPTTLIKMWVYDRKLYVEEEFWGIGVELDDPVGHNDLPTKFMNVTGAKDHVIRADNARPETISYLKTHGLPRIEAALKWSGSVEDGIAFLRSFEKVIIHPRCIHTDEESRTYRHKVDPLTGDVMPEVVDKNNHCWDAIRYGLQPLISKKELPGFFFAGMGKRDQKHEEEKSKTFQVAFTDHAIKGGQERDERMRRWLRGD